MGLEVRDMKVYITDMLFPDSHYPTPEMSVGFYETVRTLLLSTPAPAQQRRLLQHLEEVSAAANCMQQFALWWEFAKGLHESLDIEAYTPEDRCEIYKLLDALKELQQGAILDEDFDIMSFLQFRIKALRPQQRQVKTVSDDMLTVASEVVVLKPCRDDLSI